MSGSDPINPEMSRVLNGQFVHGECRSSIYLFVYRSLIPLFLLPPTTFSFLFTYTVDLSLHAHSSLPPFTSPLDFTSRLPLPFIIISVICFFVCLFVYHSTTIIPTYFPLIILPFFSLISFPFPFFTTPLHHSLHSPHHSSPPSLPPQFFQETDY